MTFDSKATTSPANNTQTSSKNCYAIAFSVNDSMTFDIKAASREEAESKAADIRETLNLDQPVEWELELIQEVLPKSPDFEPVD